METAYLTDNQIHEMADFALTSFEVSGDKARIGEAAAEYAADEFGVKATPSQIGYAVNLVLGGWDGIKMSVKAELGAPTTTKENDNGH